MWCGCIKHILVTFYLVVICSIKKPSEILYMHNALHISTKVFRLKLSLTFNSRSPLVSPKVASVLIRLIGMPALLLVLV